MLGFIIGIARLSKNWLVARLAAVYVEVIRNLPLLLQLLFWYNAVLKVLPEMRDSLLLPGGGFLNNRGLFLPQPVFKEGFGAGAGRAGRRRSSLSIAYRFLAKRRQMLTGQQAPVLWVTLALVFGAAAAGAGC